MRNRQEKGEKKKKNALLSWNYFAESVPQCSLRNISKPESCVTTLETWTYAEKPVLPPWKLERMLRKLLPPWKLERMLRKLLPPWKLERLLRKLCYHPGNLNVCWESCYHPEYLIVCWATKPGSPLCSNAPPSSTDADFVAHCDSTTDPTIWRTIDPENKEHTVSQTGVLG